MKQHSHLTPVEKKTDCSLFSISYTVCHQTDFYHVLLNAINSISLLKCITFQHEYIYIRYLMAFRPQATQSCLFFK